MHYQRRVLWSIYSKSIDGTVVFDKFDWMTECWLMNQIRALVQPVGPVHCPGTMGPIQPHMVGAATSRRANTISLACLPLCHSIFVPISWALSWRLSMWKCFERLVHRLTVLSNVCLVFYRRLVVLWLVSQERYITEERTPLVAFLNIYTYYDGAHANKCTQINKCVCAYIYI